MDAPTKTAPRSHRTSHSEDLRHAAAATSDEFWGARRSLLGRIIGLFSGDVGAKADISHGLRTASVRERAHGSRVASRDAMSGAGLAALATLAVVVAVAAAALLLLVWAVT